MRLRVILYFILNLIGYINIIIYLKLINLSHDRVKVN